MKIDEGSIFAPVPLCVSRLDKETQAVELVHIGPQTQIYKIDGVSAFIWSQLNGKNSVRAIVKNVLTEFEVTEARAKRDIRQFLDQLLMLEIIQEK